MRSGASAHGPVEVETCCIVLVCLRLDSHKYTASVLAHPREQSTAYGMVQCKAANSAATRLEASRALHVVAGSRVPLLPQRHDVQFSGCVRRGKTSCGANQRARRSRRAFLASIDCHRQMQGSPDTPPLLPSRRKRDAGGGLLAGTHDAL